MKLRFLPIIMAVTVLLPLDTYAQVPDGELVANAVVADYHGNFHLLRPLGPFLMHASFSNITHKWSGYEGLIIPKEFLLADVAPIPGSAPALAADDKGLHVFLVDAKKRMIHNYRRYGYTWGNWQVLNGQFTSMPAATTVNGKIYVVARGTDNGYWYATGEGENFSDWTAVPGGSNFTSAPVIGAITDGYIIAGRGGDGVLWATKNERDYWAKWRSMGQNLGSSPTAFSDGRGSVLIASRVDNTRIHVYDLGNDMALHKGYDVVGNTIGIPAIGYANDAATLLVVDPNYKLWFQSQTSNHVFPGRWTSVDVPPNGFIEDFKLSQSGGKDADCPKDYTADPSQDLNQGAGGAYIYLCTKMTSDPQKALRGVQTLTINKSYDATELSLRCGFGQTGEDGKPATDKNGRVVDLNAGAGGSYIYLCLNSPRTGSYFGGPYGPYVGYRWHVWHGKPLLRNICGFGDGWELASSDVTATAGDIAADLNAGAGGAWVYLCLKDA